MFRALFSRRMLAGVGLAVVFAAACVLLGRWQWGRYEDKQVRAAAVSAHYAAAPVPVTAATGRLPLSEDDQWLRVTATGRYVSGTPLLARNRVLDGQPGLEVLVPFDLEGALTGRRLLVDRGWVANAGSASQTPTVPPAPGGVVTVQGWLRSGEVDLGKDLPAGQLASINVPTVQAQSGGDLLDTYLVLQSETTAAGGSPPRPAPLAAPDTDLGPHQAYAFQWWLTSVFGFVLVGYRLRVAAADSDDEVGGAHTTETDAYRAGVTQGPDAAVTGAASATSPAGAARPERVPAAPRPKKVRIWDEEDG